MNKIKKYDVVSVGGLTRDVMFYSGAGEVISGASPTKQKLLAFEYGAKILADKIFFSFGGGAANTAVAFATLGLKAAAVARVGNDENGARAVKNLSHRGVDASLVKVDRRAATGFSVILTTQNSAKEHVAFLHRGANDFLSARDLPLASAAADWFYVSSLPKSGWEQIMSALVATKKNIVWNPGGRQLAELNKLKKFLPKIKMLMINYDEALEFRQLKEIKGLIKYIKNLGPQLVVITAGAKGAYVYDGQKYYFLKAQSVKSVDTVGVGDAFGAAFTSALIYGKNIKQALTWGIRNSASVVAKVGAQNGLLNRRQIDK
jgi:ribokinase